MNYSKFNFTSTNMNQCYHLTIETEVVIYIWFLILPFVICVKQLYELNIVLARWEECNNSIYHWALLLTIRYGYSKTKYEIVVD